MFLNQGEKKPDNVQRNYPTYPEYNGPSDSEPLSMAKMLFFFIGGILILAALVGLVYYFLLHQKTDKDYPNANKPTDATTTAATSTTGLPEDFGNNDDGDEWSGTSTDDLKAEDLTFGFFYQKPNNDYNPGLKNYNLPINTKTDVSNFYDLSRKIDLDAYVSAFDQTGFAIIDPQWNLKSDDFYSVYQYLISKDIPFVITNDFLYYYYQNNLKQVFKEIEKTTFYDNLWSINKKLYDIALTRYKKRFEEVGIANDTLLEAERLEMAYFAVALNLLKPTTEQISEKSELVNAGKFSRQEAENYAFDMPSTLADDVEKEVGHIRSARDIKKSPVFLYQKNYHDFAVPKNYSFNAKLNNFYLALRWLNSEFPLYHRGSDCSDCLLDYNDWVINLAAASLITEDLMSNQDIKNNWAVVYKIISFYNGLRQDLTYLHYHNALSKLFGKEYKTEEIFSSSNPDRDNQITKLSAEIAGNRFSSLEGGLDRSDPGSIPYIGMRLLQEPYWPNDYIFKKLTGNDKILASKENVFTSCDNRNRGLNRCIGFGLDLVNLINSNDADITTDYLQKNIDYSGYEQTMSGLQSEIGKFNVNSWNNNVYWVGLDISRTLLDYEKKGLPVFVQDSQWTKYKDVNTILGGWIYLHLPEDTLANYSEVEGSALGEFKQCNPYNYIEPNYAFVNELIARNEMLMYMLSTLKVTNKTSSALLQLKDLDAKLSSVSAIIKKELEGEKMSDDDCKFIDELAKHFVVTGQGSKNIAIKIGDQKLSETITGVKLVGVIYPLGDKKIMSLGPIFSFIESK